MNNTEKKLDALIDALGFDVEEVVTTVHPPFSIMKACFTDRYNQQGPVHTVNYKLTKRDKPVYNVPVGLGPMPVNSAAWGSIVRYILRHRMEIELGSDDFDTLRPALSFFNGTSK